MKPSNDDEPCSQISGEKKNVDPIAKNDMDGRKLPPWLLHATTRGVWRISQVRHTGALINTEELNAIYETEITFDPDVKTMYET